MGLRGALSPAAGSLHVLHVQLPAPPPQLAALPLWGPVRFGPGCLGTGCTHNLVFKMTPQARALSKAATSLVVKNEKITFALGQIATSLRIAPTASVRAATRESHAPFRERKACPAPWHTTAAYVTSRRFPSKLPRSEFLEDSAMYHSSSPDSCTVSALPTLQARGLFAVGPSRAATLATAHQQASSTLAPRVKRENVSRLANVLGWKGVRNPPKAESSRRRAGNFARLVRSWSEA